MTMERELIEIIRELLDEFDAESGIHSRSMAEAIAIAMGEEMRPPSAEELHPLILVEAARRGIRALDAPH